MSLPAILLRMEGASLFGLSLFLYARYGESWVLFAALWLVPDLGMAGYLAGTRAGATAYDLLHTYAPPGAVAAWGVATGTRPAVAIALIWFSHIGLDRLLGYGLKYPTRFRDTHLGRV